MRIRYCGDRGCLYKSVWRITLLFLPGTRAHDQSRRQETALLQAEIRKAVKRSVAAGSSYVQFNKYTHRHTHTRKKNNSHGRHIHLHTVHKSINIFWSQEEKQVKIIMEEEYHNFLNDAAQKEKRKKETKENDDFFPEVTTRVPEKFREVSYRRQRGRGRVACLGSSIAWRKTFACSDRYTGRVVPTATLRQPSPPHRFPALDRTKNRKK